MPAVQGISPPDLGATAAGCAYKVITLRGDFHTVNANLACLSGSGIICTAYTPDASANSPYTGCHTCPCPRNTPRLQQKCSCAHGPLHAGTKDDHACVLHCPMQVCLWMPWMAVLVHKRQMRDSTLHNACNQEVGWKCKLFCIFMHDSVMHQYSVLKWCLTDRRQQAEFTIAI